MTPNDYILESLYMPFRLKLWQIFVGGMFILLQGGPVVGQSNDVRDFTLMEFIGWPVIVSAIVLIILLTFAVIALFRQKRKR
jgi:hypothetical protein